MIEPIPSTNRLRSTFPGGASARLHADDLELVDQSLKHNRAARHELATRMQCVARMLAAKNARSGRPLNDDELADVVQDSLTVLWSKRATYEGRAALETWAYRVSVLEWLNALRSKRRRQGAREDFVISKRNETENEVDPNMDDIMLILDALRRLGQPDEDVIRRKHFDDASFTEIGASLEVSPNTAKFWYYRGMQRLRGWLLPQLGEEAS